MPLGSIGGVQTIAIRLGKVIRGRRLAAGLSQEQLAERATLHWTYVSQLERGRRNISLGALTQIAAGLGVRGWELLKEAEQE